MPPSDTDDDARKAAKGRIERLSVPGVPTRHLKPPRPTDPEATPPQTVLAKQRAREQARTDWPAVPPVAPRGQPAESTPVPGGRRGEPPPRNLSPAPSSYPAKVEIGDVRVEFRSRHLRNLWIWVGPVIVTIATSAYGYIRGYAKGLSDAAERLVKIETRATELGKRVAAVEERTEAVEASEAAEENSNRAERATAMRKLSDFAADVEALKAAQPRIQGLAKPKP